MQGMGFVVGGGTVCRVHPPGGNLGNEGVIFWKGSGGKEGLADGGFEGGGGYGRLEWVGWCTVISSHARWVDSLILERFFREKKKGGGL